MKYTLSIVVENQPGVLSKVISLFSRRGYNIDSLAVAAGEDPTISRITLVGEGDGYTLEQVEKQLNKLIPVIKVRETGVHKGYISRELVLIKLHYEKQQLEQIKAILDMMQAKVSQMNPQCITVEFAGTHEKCEELCDMLRPYGIREIARSGNITIETG